MAATILTIWGLNLLLLSWVGKLSLAAPAHLYD
jgi:hypothetical protein